MVSQATNNALGIVGGVVLAVCQAPQLLKLWRTKSAADLSFIYLYLYAVGLLFITIYLYFEGATVGWICESIETACGVVLILAKHYYDNCGPLGKRHLARKLQGGSANGSIVASVGGAGNDDAAALEGGSKGSVKSLAHDHVGPAAGANGMSGADSDAGGSSGWGVVRRAKALPDTCVALPV